MTTQSMQTNETIMSEGSPVPFLSNDQIHNELLGFQNTGISIVQVLSNLTARKMGERLYDLSRHHGQHRSKTVAADGTGLDREFKDVVMDANILFSTFPEYEMLYAMIGQLVQSITGENVVLSPFGPSAATVKIYEGAGSTHGWHVESNSVTGILYLLIENKSHKDEGCLEYMERGVEPSEDRAPSIYNPLMGDLVILKGHDVWHQVPPAVGANFKRVGIVFNYYYEDDVTRPVGLDATHYG